MLFFYYFQIWEIKSLYYGTAVDEKKHLLTDDTEDEEAPEMTIKPTASSDRANSIWPPNAAGIVSHALRI